MKETFAKQYDGAKFSWKNGEGIAVASELGLKAGDVPYDFLYDDSGDVGLTLKSPKTDVVKPFVLVEVTKHNGETVKWIFKSLDTPKLIVTIYND
jgi:hypothetical protein